VGAVRLLVTDEVALALLGVVGVNATHGVVERPTPILRGVPRCGRGGSSVRRCGERRPVIGRIVPLCKVSRR
jgi:hypothetical protein